MEQSNLYESYSGLSFKHALLLRGSFLKDLAQMAHDGLPWPAHFLEA